MTLNLSLDKNVYYKDEYTDKIALSGAITGMDSSKYYKVYFSYIGGALSDVHNSAYDYTFLSNRTSSNLSAYNAYIPISELSFNNNGIADILVEVDVVDKYGDINWNELAAYYNIIVYNYNKPAVIKNTVLTLLLPPSSVTEGEAIYFEGYLKDTNGNPIYNAKIDFYHQVWALPDVKLRDNANNDLYAYTQSDGSFIVQWIAYNTAAYGNTLKLIAKFAGSTDFNSDDSVVRNINILDIPPTDPCATKVCDDDCYGTDFYSTRCLDGDCIFDVLIESNSSKCGYTPVLNAEIGEITYEIDKQIGKDEITFTIPIINNSNETMYNYIKLFDANGKELDRTPNTYKYVSAGKIINIELTSKGDLLTPWSIEDVQGQLVTLKLYSSFTAINLSGYTEIDSVEFDIKPYTEELKNSVLTFETDVAEVNARDFVIFKGDLVDENGTPIIDAKINVYQQKTAWFDEVLENSNNEPLDIFTDNNGHYEANWQAYNTTLLDKTENIILIAKFDGNDIYKKADSETKNLTIYRLEGKGTPKLTIQTSQTEAIIGDEIKISGTFTREDGNPLEKGTVWVYATGGLVKNYLKDQSNNNLMGITDDNGVYQINWIAKQMDKDETIELIAKTEEDDAYYATQSLPITITLTDVKEDLKEQGDCFITNPLYPLKSDNPCIVSNTQANWIKYVAIGIGGLYALSVVSPLIKGTGKLLEKKAKEKTEDKTKE